MPAVSPLSIFKSSKAIVQWNGGVFMALSLHPTSVVTPTFQCKQMTYHSGGLISTYFLHGNYCCNYYYLFNSFHKAALNSVLLILFAAGMKILQSYGKSCTCRIYLLVGTSVS